MLWVALNIFKTLSNFDFTQFWVEHWVIDGHVGHYVLETPTLLTKTSQCSLCDIWVCNCVTPNYLISDDWPLKALSIVHDTENFWMASHVTLFQNLQIMSYAALSLCRKCSNAVLFSGRFRYPFIFLCKIYLEHNQQKYTYLALDNFYQILTSLLFIDQ